MDKANISDITRCPQCGERLHSRNDYGDWAKFVSNDKGRMVRKSEERWFDIDWVLQRHMATHA